MPKTQNLSEQQTAINEFLAYTNALARREQKFSKREVAARALTTCGDGSLYPGMRAAILEEAASVQDRNMPRTETARRKALLGAALRAIDDEHKVPDYVQIRLLFRSHGIFNRPDYNQLSAVLDHECGAIFSIQEEVENIAFLEMGVAPGDLYKRKFLQGFEASRSFKQGHAFAFFVANIHGKQIKPTDRQIEHLCEIFDKDFTPGRILNRTLKPELAMPACYWLLMGKYDSFLRQGYNLKPEIEPGAKPPDKSTDNHQQLDLEGYIRKFMGENQVLREFQQLRDPLTAEKIVDLVRRAEDSKRATRIFSFFGFAHQCLAQSFPAGIQKATASTVYRTGNPEEEIIILLNQGKPITDQQWKEAFLYTRRRFR